MSRRPFGEPYLAHQLRCYPVDVLLFYFFIEGRGFPFKFTEALRHPPEGFIVIARTDFTRVKEFIFLIVTDKQGAEADPFALGIGVTADNKLLLVRAFELQPV